MRRFTCEEAAQLGPVKACSTLLSATAGHVTAFTEMMTSRHRERLPAWITATAVDADDQLHLHSFTRGIRCDHAAVTDGLTLTHSRGPVERQRLPHKTLKRQVYGCPLAWRRHIVRPPPTLRDREHAAFVSQIAG